ncbi:hypothetical protein EUA93_06990 [Nocardioides oleivorans]|uniref:Uncharacterized protein n=1 Tax=Nocardioides oleivorans TaxID=273676 RepID=A0A4Q2RXW0_9ACTN|nr:hypothetical protein [Nocardioides oleivorans]RYB94111.1 hypothetical protein EUA93_06990 [Nocardioides oleivorans]
MSPEIDLRDRLDHELDHLPSRPAGHYLQQGRRVRRRRRAIAAGAIAAVSVVAVQVLAPGGDDRQGSVAQEPTGVVEPTTVEEPTSVASPLPDLSTDPDFVAPEPNNPVEAVPWSEVADDIDWFTTDGIPQWAQEYGSHGPVQLLADGRLWVAPDATIRRIVVDPILGGLDGATASYAVEAEYDGAPTSFLSGVVWVLLSTDGTGRGGGSMDEPGRWTDDFELWVDDQTSLEQGRPSFVERLAHFADGTSDVLVPGADGVEIVRQVQDPEVDPMWEPGTREAAAEVRWAGTTWFVQASDPRDGGAWYIPYDGSRYRDFDDFLDELAGADERA